MHQEINRRWAVMLSSPEQLDCIPEEHLQLSTRRDGEDGRAVLMYRDNFTAYKAANYAGARVLSGYLMEGEGQEAAPAMRLESGELIWLEVPRSSARA